MANPRPQRNRRKERRHRRGTAHRPTENLGFLESLRLRFNPSRPPTSPPLVHPSVQTESSSRRGNRQPLNAEAGAARRRRPRQSSPQAHPERRSITATDIPIIALLAIVLWSVLFFRYWRTGKLYLLIHPNYIWLTIAAGIVLMLVVVFKLALVIIHRDASNSARPTHISLFSPLISNTLLIGVALLGLMIEPRAFASETAVQRGLTDTLPLTRVKPQSFRATVAPESKSVIDWVRTLSAYPEPDAYTGQLVNVQGFAVHPATFPDSHLLISRFVITCCAADAYPVGLPVKLPPKQGRATYPVDQWFEVKGTMTTEILDDKRQLVIKATSLTPVPTPKNPYDY